MIVLKRFGNPWGHADLSLFCSKVETYLRMAGLEYRAEVGDVRKTPKQKLPVIVDGDTTVCDSRDVLAHLEAKRDTPMDADLNAAQRATSVAFRALVEEELYFHMLYLRWQLDEGWAVYRPVIATYMRGFGIPGFIAGTAAGAVRKQVVTSLRGQGTGRHSRDEVERRACEAVGALATQLGDQLYFLGDRPHTLDATTYAMVNAILDSPFPGSLQDFARSQPNLVAYERRVRARFYPEVADAAPAVAASPQASSTTP